MVKDPESLDELKKITPTGEIKEFVVQLASDVEEEDAQITNWRNAADLLDKLRYGIRGQKTRPWPGCANFSLPIIDTDITQLKPSYINAMFGVSPICTFIPKDADDIDPARLKEHQFDWRMRTQVKPFKAFNYGVDMVLGSQGMTVFRTIWDFQTRTYTIQIDLDDFNEEVIEALYDPRVDDEMLFNIFVEQYDVDLEFEENDKAIRKAVEQFRNGKTQIEVTLMEVAKDCPDITALSVKDDLVIPWDTKELNDARFIDYKNLWVTKNELKCSMKDGRYEEFGDNDVDAWGGQGSDDPKKYVSEDMIRLHEVCCWYDVNGDGIEERCIVTYPDADQSAILRFIELPYDHGEWPYKQIKRELLDDNFYSTRGIPYLQKDTQIGASTALNQAVDNGTLLNTPERVARKGVISNPRNRRFIPGEFTETNGSPADYETRQLVNASQPILFQQIQFLKSFSDARLGGQTQGFGETSLPGMGQGGKKTAKEIEAVQLDQGQAKSLDLLVFQNQMAEVYHQIDALYDQFGKDEEEILVEGKSERVSRDEIQGKRDIVPNGRLDNSTNQQRIQKSMFAYQIGIESPYVRQRELIVEVFKNLDMNLATKYLKTEEELAQEAQQQAQILEQEKQKAMQEQVGMKTVSDNLDIRKEYLLEPIQGKKYAAD